MITIQLIDMDNTFYNYSLFLEFIKKMEAFRRFIQQKQEAIKTSPEIKNDLSELVPELYGT